MAIKVAPEQGWGIHWNEFHPSNPFTPVEVGPTGAPAGSVQAGSSAPAAFAPATLVQSVFSAPAFADSFAKVDFGSIGLIGSQGGLGSSGGDGSQGALSLNQLSFYGDDWLVVPSVANEAGTSYASSDYGTWDVAEWSMSSDWYLV